MLVVEPVQAAIWHCLNHYAFTDATFLAEKLMAESGSDEAVFLAATCYYRQGKVEQAHHLLTREGSSTPNAKFLMAKCCSELKKDSEAESLIRGPLADKRKDIQIEDIVSNFGDKSVFALQLLSKICRRSERHKIASDLDRKALSLNPFVWSSFDSLCSGEEENIDPNTIWDADKLDSLDHVTGSNPVVNLINNTTTQSNPGGTPAPPVFVPPTPVRAPAIKMCPDKLSTPQQASVPAITVCDSPAVETPLLYCNTISSTPLHNSPGQMSGISSLNITSDSDISQTQLKMPAFLPPPLRPKTKRLLGKQANTSIGSFSPSFGMIGQTPSPAPVGVAAKLLEFSSPQIVLLSPQPASPAPQPHTPAITAPPVLPLKSSLSSTPGMPPLRSSTPGAPRVAMAAKPDNTAVKQQVLGQTNIITPSPVNMPQRRSSRLFASTQSVKENSKGPGKGRIKVKTRFKSEKAMSENELNEINTRDSLKPDKEKVSSLIESDIKPTPPSKASENQPNFNLMLSSEATKLQKSSLGALVSLMKQFGQAYLKMCQYNCKEAVKLFESLPPSQVSTNQVMTYLAKCYFELAEYKKCVSYFEKVREDDPYRLDMLAYYSTALWHLNQEVSLSALAQDLQSIDKHSPVTWCVAGNCFSLQKEHEVAIKFLQRAIQVKPDFAYAYTLLGHEYLAIEELEKGLSSYRAAVRIDPRHYNAWYGIGMTYFKQERNQLAEIYFQKALSINRYSPNLMCQVAVVQQQTDKFDAALDTFNKAIAISPKNVKCKFYRSTMLINLERYQEALEELTELKKMVPTESAVYFHIGKVHSKLGNSHLALMNYSWSNDLDPKGANSQIKDAVDPSLTRHSQDFGNQTEDQIDQTGGDQIEAGPSNSGHQDFQGEISEQFIPIMGENVESGSALVVRDDEGMESPTGAGVTVQYMMNDSDDSL